MSKPTDRLDKPSPASVNSGLSPLHQRTMIELIGAPRPQLCQDCMPPTNPRLKLKTVTKNVGPFRVTGHAAAVASLEKVFSAVKAKNPELYAMIGTAGMMCCRAVRGSKTSWSNHSWGFAIDLKIGGVLDDRGDNKCQRGLLDLYSFFHAEGWYWGTEFPTEDSMHFEVADETVRKWAVAGLL